MVGWAQRRRGEGEKKSSSPTVQMSSGWNYEGSEEEQKEGAEEIENRKNFANSELFLSGSSLPPSS